MEETAERLGALLSTQAYLLPDLWHFNFHRLAEVNVRVRHSTHLNVLVQISDAQGTVLYEAGDVPLPPTLSRVATIHDGQHPVGHVEVVESVRELWYRTALVAVGSTGLALGMFAVLRLLPLKALRRALQELTMSQHDLLRTQEELRRQESLAAVGQMTAMVNHELRNPLGSIRTSLFAIRRLVGQQPPVALLKTLDIADRSITRCDIIIHDLLDFTRQRELYYENVALDEWLTTILEVYVMPPHLTLHQNLTCGATIAMDPERLHRVVLNVLDNACQAMRDTATAVSERPRQVTVTTQAMELQARIIIEDQGMGMAPEVLERIFEPLYSTKSFGAGLGLAIVQQIMQQHGGSVAVASTPDRGTRVQLSLPTRPAGKARA